MFFMQCLLKLFEYTNQIITGLTLTDECLFVLTATLVPNSKYI